MKRTYAITITAAILVGLAGCAGDPEIYDRPRTTPDQFHVDFAGCRAMAHAMPQQRTPVTGYVATTTFHGNHATTAVGPNPYELLAATLVDAVANSENQTAVLHACMSSKGYVLRHKKRRTFDGD